MQPFDPSAATAAYLAMLSPAQHAKATAYTHGGEWLLLWNWLVTIASAWIILRTGLLARISDRLGRRGGAVAACVAVFLALSWLIELPWSVYAGWWRERSYGMTKQSLAGWLGDQGLSAVLGIGLALLFGLAIYALIRRSPRWWWAWAAAVGVVGGAVVVLASPIVIEPLFNTYTPAPAGPIRDAVVELAHRTGVPADKIMIYNGSMQSQAYTANVGGLFGTARIAMSDTMFQQGAYVSEVRAVIGHEMGHYARGHAFLSIAVLAAFLMAGLFIADRAFPRAAKLLGAETNEIADPAGLPVVIIIASILAFLAMPIANTFSRWQESDADRFSLENANEPDGLAKALVKTVAYRASSPAPVEEAIFYDHPSVERRIRRAMVWKAHHPPSTRTPPFPDCAHEWWGQVCKVGG